MSINTNELPEVIRETKTKEDSVLLRTVVKKGVYDKLRVIAQSYSTGQGHWDFGVAIQLLIDCYEQTRLQNQNEKLDMVIDLMTQEEQQPQEPEEKFVEMLGGSKIKI